jgi:hypothetical protein
MVRALFHWLGWQTREGEQPLAGLLQAVADRLSPQLADEGLAPCFDLLATD